MKKYEKLIEEFSEEIKRIKELQKELTILMNDLTLEIEMAYYDTPSAESRIQGMKKFWELSGLI